MMRLPTVADYYAMAEQTRALPWNNGLRVESDCEWFAQPCENPRIARLVEACKDRIAFDENFRRSYWSSHGGVGYRRQFVEFIERYAERIYGDTVDIAPPVKDDALLVTLNTKMVYDDTPWEITLESLFDEIKSLVDSHRETGSTVYPIMPLWSYGPILNPETFEPYMSFVTEFSAISRNNTE